MIALKTCTFIIFYFLSRAAFSIDLGASDCSHVNLITQPDSPFKKIPFYNQGDVGICYAYTAAELLNFELIKNKQEPLVHPLWAALKYSEWLNRWLITTGVSSETIHHVLSKENCPATVINNALGFWEKKLLIKQHQLEKFIQDMGIIVNAHEEREKSANPQSNGLSREQIFSLMVENYERLVIHGISKKPKLIFQEYISLIDAIKLKSPTKIFAKILEKPCASQTQKISVTDSTLFVGNQDDVWSPKIQYVLDRFKSPVEITYCLNVIDHPSYDGIERPSKTIRGSTKPDCMSHSSIIVGKKKVLNTCYYLLRNTMGENFDSWKGGQTHCLCKNKITGAFVDDCSTTKTKDTEAPYEVEGCWIEAESISKNISSITSINNPFVP